MRIRIVGDGSFHGTRVETEDGQLIEGVQAIELKLDRPDRRAVAKITFASVPLNIEAEAPGIKKAEE